MPISPDPSQGAPAQRRAPRVLELRAVPEAAIRASATVQSPCVRVCCLDDNDMCLGCGRLLAEIRDWHQSDDTQRKAVLALARARLDAS
jgi:uncharacterized protein